MKSKHIGHSMSASNCRKSLMTTDQIPNVLYVVLTAYHFKRRRFHFPKKEHILNAVNSHLLLMRTVSSWNIILHISPERKQSIQMVLALNSSIGSTRRVVIIVCRQLFPYVRFDIQNSYPLSFFFNLSIIRIIKVYFASY